MTRAELTQKIFAIKRKKGLSWAQLAKEVGRSPVWTTGALLGQMPMSKDEAQKAARMLDLQEEEMVLLQTIPMRGSLESSPPVDPTIYRFYELIQVYGTAPKILISRALRRLRSPRTWRRARNHREPSPDFFKPKELVS